MRTQVEGPTRGQVQAKERLLQVHGRERNGQNDEELMDNGRDKMT